MDQKPASSAIPAQEPARDRESALYFSRLKEMALSEWKMREQSTFYGFLWTLLNPILMFAVLYIVFTKWMGNKTANYPVYLLIGVVQYNFFQMGSTYGLSSLRRRSSIVQNFVLPKEIIPFSAVLSGAMSHAFEFCVMLVFAVLLGIRPGWSWLALPVVDALLVAFIAGLSLFLSVFEARYPDFERIWAILTNLGFFLTPIFYTLDVIDPTKRRLLWIFNPMTAVIEMTRQILIAGKFPGLLPFGGICLLTAALWWAGLAFFHRKERKIGDYLLL